MPFPKRVLSALLELTRRGRVKLEHVGLSDEYARALRRAGIVATVRGEAYLTDAGREVISALEGARGDP